MGSTTGHRRHPCEAVALPVGLFALHSEHDNINTIYLFSEVLQGGVRARKAAGPYASCHSYVV